jgi:hypothetical protein
MNMRHLNRDLEIYATDTTFLDADGEVSFMFTRNERGRSIHIQFKVGDNLSVGKYTVPNAQTNSLSIDFVMMLWVRTISTG